MQEQKNHDTAQRVYRTYDESYKREVVKLVEESNKPVAQIARELHIPTNNVRKWVKKFGTPASVRVAESLEIHAPESARVIAQLRKELAERAEELDILKKAAVYFAKAVK